MKKALAALIITIFWISVHAQESWKESSWILRFKLGPSMVHSDGTTGPMSGLELFNPTDKKISFKKSPDSSSHENDTSDYRFMVWQQPNQTYSKYDQPLGRPYRSTLAGSVGISWSRKPNKKNSGISLSDSLSFPPGRLSYEIRYNLYPQNTSKKFVQNYSNLNISLLYQFGSRK